MVQAATILNGHMASGYKDWYASQFIIEPLADFDADGNLVALLADEIPSMTNGGLTPDGLTVTWKLKQGVVWSDGEPFTSADVKFTYDYVSNPDTAATTSATYLGIAAVDTPDDHTVKITFKQPTPGWYLPFCGLLGGIVPQHLLQDVVGSAAYNAPYNLKPVGTGPYMVETFVPGDLLQLTMNPHFRNADEPHFETISIKGGGNGFTAAQAVVVTGDADYGYQAEVPLQQYDSMKQGPKGKLLDRPPKAGVERVAINPTDPRQEVDGERSHLGTPHPFQSNLNVRKAYALAVPRDTIIQAIYGEALVDMSTNVLNGPPKFVSPNTSWKYDLEEAGRLLDAEGWVKGPDGIRAKNGQKMSVVYQSSVSQQRQQSQEVLKDSFTKLGIEVALASYDSSVYFGPGGPNENSYVRFYADMELYAISPNTPFPLDYMKQFYGKGDNIAQKANGWGGVNIMRWQNSEYDAAYEACANEMDEAKQAELFIKMNDLIINDAIIIPLFASKGYNPVSNTLGGIKPSGWTGEFWQVREWYRIKD